MFRTKTKMQSPLFFKLCYGAILIMLLSLVGIAGPLTSGVAVAADQTTLAVGNVSGLAGAEVQVPVNFTSSGEVTSVQFDLTYDHNLLTYQSKTAGSLTAGYTFSTNQLTEDKLRLIITSSENALIAAGSGTVVVFNFQVSAGAQQNQQCALAISGFSLADSNGDAVAGTVTNGQFSVPPTASALTADSTDNIVGQDIILTFTDNPDWQAAINGVSVDGSDLDSTKYTIAAGTITLDKSVFVTAKDYAIVVRADGYDDTSLTQSVLAVPPTLTADSTDNIVGQDITITFTDNVSWQAAINGVSVDGSALDLATKCTIAAGTITLDKSVFATAKDYNIVVRADGYGDAKVLQPIQAAPGLAAGYITTLAGTDSSGFLDGAAASAKFNNIRGLTVDPATGSLYIADSKNHRIRKIASDGTVSTVAGTGTGGYLASQDGKAATSARLKQPYDMALDSVGNLYICDSGNYRIRKIDTNGIITTIAGTGTSGYTGDSGPAVQAKICVIKNIVLDKNDNIYFTESSTDGNSNRIRKIDTSGIISTVASTTFAGSPCPIDGLTIDSAGNLYAAASGFNVVLKIDPAGTVTTAVGTGESAYNGDGMQATYANLSQPYDVVADAAGNLYIADSDHNRIRKVDTTGIITTIAGDGSAQNSGDGGPALNAKINFPTCLALDAQGKLYIGFSTKIRYIQLAEVQSSVAPPVLTADSTDNKVGQDITLSFTADETWQSKISGLSVDGTAYDSNSGKYTIASGTITLDKSVFGSAKDYAIIISASGYSNATVTQTVNAAPVPDLTPPALTADSTDNKVGQDITLSFTADEMWQSKISGLSVDGTAYDSNSNKYTIASGIITLDKSVFGSAKDYVIIVSAAGYSNATVTQTMAAQSGGGHAHYTLTPVADTAYTNNGTTNDMTVNSGINGLKYFTVNINPIEAHSGLETVVFTHWRNGLQLELGAIKADFDSVPAAVAGFNVQTGDVVKVFIVDDLSNALNFNPTILQ